jgi:hypothetical protein
MEKSKSTDKLEVLKSIITEIDEAERIKSITISWKLLESEEIEDAMWLPCLHIEYYEGKRPDGEEPELNTSGDIPEKDYEDFDQDLLNKL